MSITQTHTNKLAEFQRGTDVLDTSWHELHRKPCCLTKHYTPTRLKWWVREFLFSFLLFFHFSVSGVTVWLIRLDSSLLVWCPFLAFQVSNSSLLLLFGFLAALIHSLCSLLSEYITEYNKNRIFPAVRIDLIWVKFPCTFFQLCCGVSNHE